MTLVSSNEYRKKAESHTEWLCWIFGITTIVIAITALSFPSPWRVAWLGLVAVIPMYVRAFTGVPEELKLLRALAKDRSAADREVAATRVREIEKEFHGWRTARRMLVLWLALALYACVCLSFAEPFSHLLAIAR